MISATKGRASVIWSAKERAAWAPIVALRPSEWAEKYRYLSRRQSAIPGRWRNANAPYLADLLDLCISPDVDEVTIVKAAQTGVSEGVARNLIGYFAHQEPDPLLLVLPDENTGRRIVSRRLWPLFKETPVLNELLTDASRDVQLRSITLANGFVLSLAWSGSPATLAADPQRVVINDEVDKFSPWSGREADPISLAKARTQTYGARKLVLNISTPTTRDGLISQRYDAATVHLYYAVPCPHCRAYQRLTFDRLRWEKPAGVKGTALAAQIEAGLPIWYQCRACDGRILDKHKPVMTRAGRWVAETQTIDESGVVCGERPPGRHVAAHISALYPLWVSFSAVAAEFLRSEGNLQAMMNFRNSWLGEVFEQQVQRAPEPVYIRKQRESRLPPGIVPNWARILTATADVQQDRVYFVVRAWGVAFRSHLVEHGTVHGLEDLYRHVFGRRYPVEDTKTTAICSYLGVDAGYRTQEVYALAFADQARVKPIVGRGEKKQTGGKPMRITRATYIDPNRVQQQVAIRIIDSEYYKDRLSAMIGATVDLIDDNTGEITGSAEQWALNSQADEDYARQMASEHKILVRDGKKTPVERWQPVTSGAQNHYWDCEVYQVAMSDIAGVLTIPSGPISAPTLPKVQKIMTPDGRPFLVTQR